MTNKGKVKFSGKTYSLYGKYSSKAQATHRAKLIRKDGMLARVTKTTKDAYWYVYWRSKLK